MFHTIFRIISKCLPNVLALSIRLTSSRKEVVEELADPEIPTHQPQYQTKASRSFIIHAVIRLKFIQFIRRAKPKEQNSRIIIIIQAFYACSTVKQNGQKLYFPKNLTGKYQQIKFNSIA